MESRKPEFVNFLMGAQENNHQISQNYILHMKFQNFTCVFTILVKFDIHFLGLQFTKFLSVAHSPALFLFVPFVH